VIAEMDNESIFDEPLFRLAAVIVVLIVVIALVATNAMYFGEQLPVAQLPKTVPQDIDIQIVYEGDWRGTYSDVCSTMSISGTGAKTIPFPETGRLGKDVNGADCKERRGRSGGDDGRSLRHRCGNLQPGVNW
jgi:hypothetical protein